MTKASTEGDADAGNGKEAKIQSLTAYVFDEAGKYVISKHVSLEGSGTVGEDYNVTGEGENQSITSIKAIHVKVAKPTTEGGILLQPLKLFCWPIRSIIMMLPS